VSLAFGGKQFILPIQVLLEDRDSESGPEKVTIVVSEEKTGIVCKGYNRVREFHCYPVAYHFLKRRKRRGETGRLEPDYAL
jgi:hypothetical protein